MISSDTNKSKIPGRKEVEWTGKCYGYIRIAPKSQANDGPSLDEQTKMITAQSQLSKLKIIRIFSDDGISGLTMDDRPSLVELLKTAERGDTVMVFALDRLTKTSDDAITIIYNFLTRGCRIYMIEEKFDSSNKSCRSVLEFIETLARLKVGTIPSQVKIALSSNQEKKHSIGRPPYGWKLANGPGSDLVEVPEEQEIRTRIRNLREGTGVGVDANDGKELSYDAIAKVFVKEGIPPPRKSKEWHPAAIRRCYLQETPVWDRGVNSKPK